MSSGMVSVRLQNILGATLLATASFVAPTSPLMLQLDSAVGSETAGGTQISGGSYTATSLGSSTPFGATMSYATGVASGSNANAVSFTNMPAVTVTSIEIWDSAGTPLRWWWGTLTTSETTNAGDTLTFAVGSIVPSMSG